MGECLTPPPSRKLRTHVLCFDGTVRDDQGSGEKTTYAGKLYSMLERYRSDDQTCLYQMEPSTPFEPGVALPLFPWSAGALDEDVAWYLYTHVMDAYKSLVQNYSAGDRICLFAFSRGAYAACALAEMLHTVGLLLRENTDKVVSAFETYASAKTSGAAIPGEFKRAYCLDIYVDFLGVWDTVASMGTPLPAFSIDATIKVFRHALTFDETSSEFLPNHPYQAPSKSRAQTVLSAVKSGVRDIEQTIVERGQRLQQRMNKGNPDLPTSDKFPTDIDEVWFAVAPSNDFTRADDPSEYALANLPLRWMVQETLLADCGIEFEEKALARLDIPRDFAQREKQKRIAFAAGSSSAAGSSRSILPVVYGKASKWLTGVSRSRTHVPREKMDIADGGGSEQPLLYEEPPPEYSEGKAVSSDREKEKTGMH